MSELALFLKKNKIKKENRKIAVTNSLLDADGKPVLWELKPLSTAQSEAIREDCTERKRDEKGRIKSEFNSGKYIAKIICACIVEPNLYNAELQDSYGVQTPEDLLKEMVDDPIEYQNLALFVQNFNGLDQSFEDEVETAKN